MMALGIPPRYRGERYGQGEYQIEEPEYLLSPQAMVAHLRQILTSPAYSPPLLPTIALDLMQLTRQSDVSVQDVRQLLEKDPLLAAKVLQLAQSALYSPGVPVRSLEEAITRLGLRTLGDVFLQTVLSTRVFRAKGYDQPMAALMRHSTLTAHVARIACRLTAIPDEYAFMCGLLHDAGMAAGLIIFADSRATSNPAGGSGGAPSFEEVAVALDVVHEEASAILADAWHLNPEMRLVLGSHHHLSIGGRIHPLAAIVCVADHLASEAGAPLGSESEASHLEEAIRSLGFTERTLQELGARAREILALL